MIYSSFEEIKQHLVDRGIKKRIVLCGAQDDIALQAVVRARRDGIIDAVLIGDAARILPLLDEMGESSRDYEIVNETREILSATKAIRMVREGAADIPMKGLMQSASYLMAIKNPVGGLMDPGAMLNEATAFYYRDQKRILIAGDCAINVAPTLEEKVMITRNLIQLARVFGCREVKVAAVSVLEKPDPSIPSTVDAAALAAMDWGENVFVEGPFALDNALDPEAARHKGIQSNVAGAADVLLMPDIHAGNVLHKAIHFFGHFPFASITCGTRTPCIFNSRTDDAEAKYNSILSAVLQSL